MQMSDRLDQSFCRGFESAIEQPLSILLRKPIRSFDKHSLAVHVLDIGRGPTQSPRGLSFRISLLSSQLDFPSDHINDELRHIITSLFT